jgi:hypothetical protein
MHGGSVKVVAKGLSLSLGKEDEGKGVDASGFMVYIPTVSVIRGG